MKKKKFREEAEESTDVVPAEENKLTRREKFATIEREVRKLIGKGKNDLEIIEKLGISQGTLDKYKKRILDYDREEYEGYSNVKVYSMHKAFAEQNIKDLEEMRVKFRNRGQWTALVAAIKQKHEIQKDMFKMGQELGFIEKRASEIKVENELTFATMSTEDVKKEVEKERAKLNHMAGMNVIEMRPELVEMLDDDTEKIQKFVPANIRMGTVDAEVVPKKTKTKIKIKQKIKLKK